jgi:hypothetical protein
MLVGCGGGIDSGGCSDKGDIGADVDVDVDVDVDGEGDGDVDGEGDGDGDGDGEGEGDGDEGMTPGTEMLVVRTLISGSVSNFAACWDSDWGGVSCWSWLDSSSGKGSREFVDRGVVGLASHGKQQQQAERLTKDDRTSWSLALSPLNLLGILRSLLSAGLANKPGALTMMY